uniref:Uncharacterized protein n=1 Tax=Avena sativa TaxID=4498 RepID=A0ACD5ZP33_AVESA
MGASSPTFELREHARRHQMTSRNTAPPERICDFHPSLWNDFFIRYEPEPLQISKECMMVKEEKLKEDVHMLFKKFNTTMIKKLTLVDTLQRLGIDHLFEQQINIAINEIHEGEFDSCSLYDVSLHFRLLREYGLRVSPDVFNKFKGENGRFHKDTINEPKGLLSLYKAAYVSVHGESKLDEAISVTRHHLESLNGSLKYPLSEEVKRNIQIPYPRILKRIDAPFYIEEYSEEQECNPSILELAKINFNFLQRLHQLELKDFCRWGNDLYKELELSYSRDRIVECYFWAYTVHYEEHYVQARLILAKHFVLASFLDDTFDMHATLEEGRKLNEAIQRWEENAIVLLPGYLKRYYIRLMNAFREFEEELKPEHKYRVSYSRKAFQNLCKHYQQESEWFHISYIPSFEDHLKCSVISAGTPMLCVASLVGMGEEATKEAFDWAIGCTSAVKGCGEVTRFMDDLAAFKHGKNKLDVANCIESYINQHDVKSEVAIAVMDNLVEDAWKTINQDRFDRRALLPVVNRVVNLTKSMTLLFHDKNDHYTFSHGNKDRIHQQFVEPIPL